MREQKGLFGKVDWLLVITYLALVVIGWINIYAAVYDETHHSIMDTSCNYGKQMIFIIASIVIAIIILLLDAKIFFSFAWFFYIGAMLVLIGVALFGSEVAGAKAWFKIGNFSIQPAEFAKAATALALAKYLSHNPLDPRIIKPQFLAATIILLPVLLIILQNDTGTALVFFALFVAMYREGMSGWVIIIPVLIALLCVLTLLLGEWWIIAGVALTLFAIWYFLLKYKMKKLKYVLAIFGCCVFIILGFDTAFDYVLSDYQKNRIYVTLGMEKDQLNVGYNVHQSLIAIGSGGMKGKGFLEGTQTKFDFVPEQSTDFIFCTVGEEWGFIGSSIVILLFVFLIFRILRNAERQRSVFSRIYGCCVALIFAFHVVVNIGMVLGLLPVIGIPLPFLSYGGSSLLGFTILLFIFIKQDANRLSLL
ncbi:MAG: rod shape-determining protein RodA [Bacteroidales bacterium]|jgi:rod shape determining protein RodA|nr:rod shape-determining protein RodA [Bacteroidales bacterium]